ncbi:MAG TPA: hypothetical protein VGR57_07080 [Ktedonobacterales bacterium]|nr:hypothetical protein [Ktedonobacterales bacterium]
MRRGFVIEDGVKGNTPEDGVVANLRFTLQLLAAYGRDQLDHYLPPLHGDITGDMAEDYDNWAKSVHTYWTLTDEQTQALRAILAYFDAHDYDQYPTFWEVEALVSDERWEQVRQLAQTALAEFGWPVEVPPRQKYIWYGPVE